MYFLIGAIPEPRRIFDTDNGPHRTRSQRIFDLVVINVDRMREPDIVSQPSKRFHPIHRAELEAFERYSVLSSSQSECEV